MTFALVTLPNAITFSRVALVPFFLAALCRGDAAGYAVCYGILALCESSDVLDGAVARARGSVSSVGMLLDPLADTITRFCMFLGLLSEGLAPLWMVVVLFVRDIGVAYLRSFAACEGIVLSARQSGKVKAVVQAVALFAVCTALMLGHRQEYALASPAGIVLVLSALAGAVFPVILAVCLRVDRRALCRLCVFALAMLAPAAVVWLTPPALSDIRWFATAALWVAVTVTAYSFFDYLAGFRQGHGQTDIPKG